MSSDITIAIDGPDADATTTEPVEVSPTSTVAPQAPPRPRSDRDGGVAVHVRATPRTRPPGPCGGTPGAGGDGSGGHRGGSDPPPSQRPSRQHRRPSNDRGAVTAAVLAVDALAVVLTIAGVGGAIRLWLGLAFVLAVPGWAVVGYLRLAWPAAEISLGLGASLAIVLLGSEIMLWLHAWHPQDLQFALGAASAVLLVGQLRHRPRQVGVS